MLLKVSLLILAIVILILSIFIGNQNKENYLPYVPIPQLKYDKPIPKMSKTGYDYTSLAKKYAPLAVFHQDQRWGPATVEYMFKNMNVQVHQEDGEDANWLFSNQKLDSPSDILPWFYGPLPHYTPKKAIPPFGRGPLPGTLYCFVLENEKGYFDVTKDPNTRLVLFYAFLFPYNRGKDVCIGIKAPFLGCIGGYQVMGNHVGDIEVCAVTLDKDLKPLNFIYGAHTFTFWNKWDNSSAYCGDDQQKKLDGYYPYCPFLTKWNSETNKIDNVNGTHPIVYLALDSHGTWIDPKVHLYKEVSAIGLKLEDDTSKPGFQWETWKNLKVISRSYWSGKLPLPTPYQGITNWFTQIARWGDKEKGCIPKVGQCRQEDGPGGFDKGAVLWLNTQEEDKPVKEHILSPDAKVLYEYSIRQ
jgi:hypothetical protein